MLLVLFASGVLLPTPFKSASTRSSLARSYYTVCSSPFSAARASGVSPYRSFESASTSTCSVRYCTVISLPSAAARESAVGPLSLSHVHSRGTSRDCALALAVTKRFARQCECLLGLVSYCNARAWFWRSLDGAKSATMKARMALPVPHLYVCMAPRDSLVDFEVDADAVQSSVSRCARDVARSCVVMVIAAVELLLTKCDDYLHHRR